jgi:hypothetical protein
MEPAAARLVAVNYTTLLISSESADFNFEFSKAGRKVNRLTHGFA